MKKVAFIFPGQGAQTVGMGRDFYEKFEVARKTFEEADEILGYKISDIIFEGPNEKLVRTEYSQLAIFIVSVAIFRVVQSMVPALVPTMCAGLSLGEYSALFASGRVSFKDALQVVQKRASFMNEACEKTKGTMAAVLGLDVDTIRAEISSLNPPHDIWVANYNCPGQTVISGSKEGVELAAGVLKEKGAKRVLPLQVHGAFHSGYMKEAQDKLAPHIAKLVLQESNTELVMNVPGNFVKEEDEIRKNLLEQVTHSVCWQQGIEAMRATGVDLYIEFGPGKTLSGMNKKMGVSDKTLSVNTIADLERLIERMGDVNAAT